jgi:hypothetical protein
MKWVAVAIALVVAGAVAGIAVDGWGWRDDTSAAAESQDQSRARAYADELAALCDPACELVSLESKAPGVWKLHELNSEGERVCVEIILEDFRRLADGTFQGVITRPCWGR